MAWLIRRLLKIVLVGTFLGLGVFMILIGLGILPAASAGVGGLIKEPWYFLYGTFWFGAGVLFFERD